MEFESMFDDVMQKASTSIKMEEGDYVKDGLIYCGKCNTPKQTEVTIFGKVKKPMCLCECGKRRVEEEKRKKTESLFKDRVEQNRIYCFGSKKNLLEWTFETAEETESVTVAKNYIKNFKTLFKEGKGLMLFGGIGTGKTVALLCIANRLLDAGYTVKFSDFAEISNNLFCATDKQSIINELASVDALIIDDFAIERATEYMQEIIFSVINARANAEKPLFITTNLTAKQINNPEDVMQQRIMSRMLKMTIPYGVKGTDLRKQSFLDTYTNYANMLKGK